MGMKVLGLRLNGNQRYILEAIELNINSGLMVIFNHVVCWLLEAGKQNTC